MAIFTGTPNNDAIVGTDEADTIDGFAGMDTLVGMGGNDTINGGDDNDGLMGGAGNDTLTGGTGADQLTGGEGLDSQFGGDGDDWFNIMATTELVAAETYDGGSGIDTFSIHPGLSSFQPLALNTVTLTGIERLEFGGFGITVQLSAAQMNAFSYVAANVLVTGGGTVVLSGREFNGSIQLSDNAATVDLTGLIGYVGAVIGGAGADTLIGSGAIDSLLGGDGADTISGAGGNDYLRGGGGIDTVSGGAGDDILVFGGNAEIGTGEVIDGGDGYDTIRAVYAQGNFEPLDLTTSTLIGIEALAPDYDAGGVRVTVAQINALQEIHGSILVAGSGSVSLAGINANNSVYGLADTVSGFSAVGVIGSLNGVYAGNNDNTLTGYDGFDYFDGAGGNDTITGNGGDDQLLGKDGNDTLTGGAGADQLSGGDGVDQLYGGDGDDVLKVESSQAVVGEVYDGGAGNDKLDLNGGTLNLSQQTITGIEWLDAGPYATVTLSVAQFAGFQTLGGHFAISAAGTVSFADKTLLNFQLDTSAAGNTVDLTGSTIAFANIYGNSGIDVITGSTGNDFLQGAGGGDTLRGAGGNDTLWGGAGLDTLEGGAGDDQFLLQAATELAAGEIYDGGEGIDTFKSNHVGDFSIAAVTLVGIEKIDLGFTIALTLSSAQLDSFSDIGQGHFKLSDSGSIALAGVASSGAFFTLSAAGNTLDLRGFAQDGTQVTGGAGNDTVWATAGNDILSTQGGADWLAGGDGNDSLSGGTGIDTFYGGTGHDTFVLDETAELVFEAAGEGTDIVIASASHYLFANVENLSFTGNANLFGVGNVQANMIAGNTGANLLLGGAGDDTVNGNAGNDQLFGEDGIDTLRGDAGIDYLAAGIGNDFLYGGADADNLYGEDGDDLLDGGDSFHTDILVGGAGNDTLDGISGQANPDYDLMDGGSGNDTYFVDTGADLTFEGVGGGVDTVHANIPVANAGVYLYANVENLVLEGTTAFGVGNELANQLTGSASGNWLLGGAGNDRIAGLAGNDVLFGEAGADTFVFGANSGADVIGDFAIPQDVIEFASTFTSFAQAQASFVQNGADGAINLGGGNLIVLHGVTMANLTAANFTFTAAAESPKAAKAAAVMEPLSPALDPADPYNFADHSLIRWLPELHAEPMYG